MSAVSLARSAGAAPQPRFSSLGHVAVVATGLAASGGLGCGLGLAAAGATLGPLDIALCAGPALVTAAMGTTSQTDRDQYTARVLVPALMLPILLMMWATSRDVVVPQWAMIAAVFGFILLQVLGFGAIVFMLAASTTRIDAVEGAAAVDAATLASRLQVLLAGELPWRLSRGATAHEFVLESHRPDAEQRCHRVLLNIDEARREVQVRERLGASGAAPADAGEASMRSLGDAPFDATRPDAQKVASRTFQTTMIQPERLAQVRLHLMGRHAQAEGGVMAEAADGETMLTLLAALVTRSGYAWQPVMALRS